ncbi:hypothetical protein [Sphingomonas koreensis]
MRGFIAYGLRVRSDIDIPGALAADTPDAADLSIELAAASAVQSASIYRFEGADLCFTAPGIAEYRCRADGIRVTPHPDASAADVAEMLIATALPALLWLRGGFVLHAAAARLPGHGAAIAIAGASGSGKSTVLAQLADAGASVLADDTILLDARNRPGEGAGLAGGYYLAREDAPRRFQPVPATRALVRAPIAAILILSRGDPGTAGGLTRITQVEAVAQLLANRHRPRVPALLGRQAATLADSALLAGLIPIYAWRRPAGARALAAGEWTALARCAGDKGVEHDG